MNRFAPRQRPFSWPQSPPPRTSRTRKRFSGWWTQYTEIARWPAALAHEIKNPLSTIRLNMELLAEDFADAETPARAPGPKTRSQSCSASASGLQNLLDDFLNFAKVRHARSAADRSERGDHRACSISSSPRPRTRTSRSCAISIRICPAWCWIASRFTGRC